MKTKNMKTTMMTILAAALIGTIGIGAQSAYAETIDFETYIEDNQVGTDSTTLMDVIFSMEDGSDGCSPRDGTVVEEGGPAHGFVGDADDTINAIPAFGNSLSNNEPGITNIPDWESCDYVINFEFSVLSLSLDFLDAGEPDLVGGNIVLEIFSDYAQTASLGTMTVDVDSVGSNESVNLSISDATGSILSARLSDGANDIGSAIDNVTYEPADFQKVNNCDGKVFIKKHTGTQDCSFTIYPGIGDSTDMIHDTVPAEWGVLSAKTAEDNDCFVEPANKGKKADKSATHIWCPVDEGPITVDVTTRESPGKGHTKNNGDPAYKPTFCGILTLNDGAQRVDENEIVLDTTDPLLLLVSENGDDGEDCDRDGLTDAFEFAAGTCLDPANPDSDDDTLEDGAEVNTHGTDPCDTDSDDDGFLDGLEVTNAQSDPTLFDPCAAATNDVCIDVDGAATRLDGITAAPETFTQVKGGDSLISFGVVSPSLLTVFDYATVGTWDTGVTGDDLFIEGGLGCLTGFPSGLYSAITPDCKVLDVDGTMPVAVLADCDLTAGGFVGPCPFTPPLLFFDGLGATAGAYDATAGDGEDIILDDGDGIFN